MFRLVVSPSGEFRCFSRDWIAERGDNLDISWLNGDRGKEKGDLPEPATLAREAITELEGAITKLQRILRELGENVD